MNDSQLKTNLNQIVQQKQWHPNHQPGGEADVGAEEYYSRRNSVRHWIPFCIITLASEKSKK